MPTIYRRRGSESLHQRYLEAVPLVEEWKQQVQRTVESRVSPDAQAEFLSNLNSRVIDRFVIRSTVPEPALCDGWRYIKTRRTIEPRVGLPGYHAHSFRSTIQIPTDQPGHLLTAAGLPATYSAHGEELPVEWMFCSGSLWFSIPSAGAVTELGDDWEPVPVTEFSALQESWAREGATITRHSDKVPVPA